MLYLHKDLDTPITNAKPLTIESVASLIHACTPHLACRVCRTFCLPQQGVLPGVAVWSCGAGGSGGGVCRGRMERG